MEWPSREIATVPCNPADVTFFPPQNAKVFHVVAQFFYQCKRISITIQPLWFSRAAVCRTIFTEPTNWNVPKGMNFANGNYQTRAPQRYVAVKLFLPRTKLAAAQKLRSLRIYPHRCGLRQQWGRLARNICVRFVRKRSEATIKKGSKQSMHMHFSPRVRQKCDATLEAF